MTFWVAGAVVAGSVGSALISGNAAQKASSGQVNEANNATALEQQEFNTIQGNQQPFINAGQGAVGQLAAGTQPGGQFSGSFTPQDFLNNQDPAYGFMQQQGQQAVERSGAAQGLDLSGGTLKGLTQYSQGLASNEYQNAYNRYMSSRNQNYSELSGLAGIGSGANATAAQAGIGMTGQIANSMAGGANAAAAGTVGQANAFSGALGSMGNYAGQYGILSQVGLLGGGQTFNNGVISNAGNVNSGIDMSGINPDNLGYGV
jgi:hypothetical protein